MAGRTIAAAQKTRKRPIMRPLLAQGAGLLLSAALFFLFVVLVLAV